MGTASMPAALTTVIRSGGRVSCSNCQRRNAIEALRAAEIASGISQKNVFGKVPTGGKGQ